MRQHFFVFVVALALGVPACGGKTAGGGPSGPDAGDSTTPDAGPDDPPPPPPEMRVAVTLEPRAGVTGTQRVNFAVPLGKGWVAPADEDRVRVLAGDEELRVVSRVLARHPDGSPRSIQVQVETAVAAGAELDVRFGEDSTTTPLSIVSVSTTLDPSDGTMGPR